MSSNSSDATSLCSDRTGKGLRLGQEEQRRFLRERKLALEETVGGSQIIRTLADIGKPPPPGAAAGALRRRPRARSEKSEGEPEPWDVDSALRDWREGAAPAASAQGPSPVPVPEIDEQGPLPSAGSAAHAVGTCLPCHYVHAKAGCEKGASCGFCHYKHPRRRRKKAGKPGEEDGDGDELPGPAPAPSHPASSSAPPAGIIDGSRPYMANEGDIVRL